MKRPNSNRTFKTLSGALFALLGLALFLGAGFAGPSGPPSQFPGGRRGLEAITSLQDRLPAVASNYGKSAERLKEIFLHDGDLWLDPADNLLFLCSFTFSGAEALPESGQSPIPTGPFPLSQTFQLHSLAGASRTIYLDFDGHVTSGTIWNSNFTGGADIVSAPYNFEGSSDSFSDAELARIQKIWARVAEDFAMYSIDVTTEEPGTEALRYSGSGDAHYGIRVVISPTSDFYPGAGGVAYVGSFDWGSDTPTFVFSGNLGNGNEKYVTDAASHEVGHTLGLYHDGKTDGTAYYSGHGDWAPIMGVGYYQPITQWSKGEYTGANNHEDDLAVMLNNGASYRPDDYGDWIDSATMLSGDVFSVAGLIERTGDIDVFGFQADAGNVTITADPANLDPNLDILLQILDNGGNIVTEADPYYILPASLNINLPAGAYYILIDGVGTGDPDTGYTDYASLGQYFIAGTLPVPQFPPDPPSGLSAVAASSSAADLSWTDNSLNENGFIVERSPNGTDSWSTVGTAGTNGTTYTDSGLIADSTYYYRVAAFNSIGDSGYSNIAEATTLGLPPAAPSGLAATPVSSGIIDLHWTDNSDNETGFAIERSPDGNDSWQEIAAAAADETAYSDTGLASGTTYFYRVAAYNASGSSGFAGPASATTEEVPPLGPTNLTAAAASYTQIDLDWLDNSDNETGFTMERSEDGTSWSTLAAPPGNSTSYADSTVSAGTTYYYRIFAYNDAGVSGYSNTATATTAEPPQYIDQTASQEASVAGSANGTFTDTQAGDSAIETITERTSGGRPDSRYSYLEHKWIFQVQAGSSMIFFANTWSDAAAQGEALVFSWSRDDQTYNEMFAVVAESDDDSYQAYTLPDSLSGSVYIKVEDVLRTPGIYDRSTLSVDHLFIRTDNAPGTLPAAPSGLSAEALATDAISLTWIDNSDNELGFAVERSPDGSGEWVQAGTVGEDVNTYIDSGLSAYTLYNYRVLAFNGAGGSGYSDPASATTLPFQGDSMHIGSLTGTSAPNRSRWWDAEVTIAVVDQDDIPVTGATVEGAWDIGGADSCVTDNSGSCTLGKTRLKTSASSVTFTVLNTFMTGYSYDPGSNAADSIEIFSP